MIDFSRIPSPCYVIDEGLLRRNLTLIKEVQDNAKIEIILAFKGFAMWKVFPIIRKYFSGVAASSVFEAQLAYDKMKTYTHTYSPAYVKNDFEKIIKYSNYITFNSLNQFHTFFPVIKKSGRKISVGLRINPEYSEVSPALYNPCSPGSRLGINSEQMPDKLPEGIEGLHFHNLCESDSYALEKTLLSVEEKFGKYLKNITWINMGGGHLMTRKGYDTNHLISVLKKFKEKYDIHIILEPGAAFVWQTGCLISSVVDIVENNKIKTAILDVSFTAHMPDCLEMPYQPAIRNAQKGANGKFVYRMGGNSCLAGDFIGNWIFEDELRIGDRIIFEDMIHYTMVKTTMFNGVNHPSIGIWTKNNKFKLYKKFYYFDYKNRLS